MKLSKKALYTAIILVISAITIYMWIIWDYISFCRTDFYSVDNLTVSIEQYSTGDKVIYSTEEARQLASYTQKCVKTGWWLYTGTDTYVRPEGEEAYYIRITGDGIGIYGITFSDRPDNNHIEVGFNKYLRLDVNEEMLTDLGSMFRPH